MEKGYTIIRHDTIHVDLEPIRVALETIEDILEYVEFVPEPLEAIEVDEDPLRKLWWKLRKKNRNAVEITAWRVKLCPKRNT